MQAAVRRLGVVERRTRHARTTRPAGQVAAPALPRTAAALRRSASRLVLGVAFGVMTTAPAAADVFFGDLHAHSGLSDDATGSAEGLFLAARDVVGLDFVALTDHDAFLTLPEWDILRLTAGSFDQPGRFVAFTGVEWTHRWHMNAYFVSDEVPLCPGGGCPEASDFYAFYGPAVVAEAAAAHVNHPADVFKVYWDEIDDTLTTNVEVWNTGSEGDNEPGFGNALWALRTGFRLGLLGVSDDHHTDREPFILGTGLTACRGESLTRAVLLEELRARRCWATNGARIELDVRVASRSMGATMRARIGSRLPIDVQVTAPAGPFEIEMLQGGRVIAMHECASSPCAVQGEAFVHDPNDFIHVRVRHADGGRAWSSPIWIEGLCAPDQNCLADRVVGRGATRHDCLAGWLLPASQSQKIRTGRVARIECSDGDPRCDTTPTDGECTVRAGLCFGATTPAEVCTTLPTERFTVLFSGPRPNERGSAGWENAATLRAIHRAWSTGASDVACSPLAELRAPIGRTRLAVAARSTGALDVDALVIDCAAEAENGQDNIY